MKKWLLALFVSLSAVYCFGDLVVPTVLIKDEGTNVKRTPYINFTGVGVAATSSGGGVDVTISGGGGGGGGQGVWYSPTQSLIGISTVGVFGDIQSTFSGSSVVIRVNLSTYTAAIIGLNASTTTLSNSTATILSLLKSTSSAFTAYQASINASTVTLYGQIGSTWAYLTANAAILTSTQNFSGSNMFTSSTAFQDINGDSVAKFSTTTANAFGIQVTSHGALAINDFNAAGQAAQSVGYGSNYNLTVAAAGVNESNTTNSQGSILYKSGGSSAFVQDFVSGQSPTGRLSTSLTAFTINTFRASQIALFTNSVQNFRVESNGLFTNVGQHQGSMARFAVSGGSVAVMGNPNAYVAIGTNTPTLVTPATNYVMLFSTSNPSGEMFLGVMSDTGSVARIGANTQVTTLTVTSGLLRSATGFTFSYGANSVSFESNAGIYQNGVLLTPGTGGGGASNYREVQFSPYSAKLSTGNNSKGPGLVSGTTYFYLQYSANITNAAQWQGMIPNDYSTTTLTADIDYVAADGVTSGTIQWDIYMSSSTTNGWGVANSTSVTVPAVSGERGRASVALADVGLKSQGWFRLRLDRNPEATDTVASSGTVIGLRLRY